MIKLDLINPPNSKNFSEKNSVIEENTVFKFEEIDIIGEKEIQEKGDGGHYNKRKNEESLHAFNPNGTDNITSLHLQSDLANLKRLEQEIQAALNSLKTVNSQNLTDFIS